MYNIFNSIKSWINANLYADFQLETITFNNSPEIKTCNLIKENILQINMIIYKFQSKYNLNIF